jgi:outer membrane receptor protein involved in Fe transport
MDKSPDFFLMNIQISKTIRERLEIYLGIENLLDYTQKNPIIAADEPFSEYFDASMIWGPVYGRNTYLGIRYRLK